MVGWQECFTTVVEVLVHVLLFTHALGACVLWKVCHLKSLNY